jgi:hypothetical protein
VVVVVVVVAEVAAAAVKVRLQSVKTAIKRSYY